MNTTSKTRTLTQFSILFAIEALFCFTPLGSLPVGPMVATLAMVPIILTAVLMGTGYGSLMGFLAGVFSFVVWTFMPPSPALAFIFTPFYSLGEVHGNIGSILICFLPRILVGTITGLVFDALKKLPGKLQWLRYGLAGLLGSLVNTLGVLGGIWLFFGDMYSSILGMAMSSILLTILTSNGALEALISALSSVFICMPIKRALEKQTRS